MSFAKFQTGLKFCKFHNIYITPLMCAVCYYYLSRVLHRTVKAAKTPGMRNKQSRQAKSNLRGAVKQFMLDSPNTTLNDTDDAHPSNIIGNNSLFKYDY